MPPAAPPVLTNVCHTQGEFQVETGRWQAYYKGKIAAAQNERVMAQQRRLIKPPWRRFLAWLRDVIW